MERRRELETLFAADRCPVALFLFGWLAWKGGALPNWLVAVGIIGGAAGLLTLAVYQTPMLALLRLACFAIWEFATGTLLFQRTSDPANNSLWRCCAGVY